MNKISIDNLTAEEFSSTIRNIVKDEIKGALTPHTDPEKLYTREQTAEKLHISKPTLHLRTKKGLIKASYLGSRVLYKHKDILAALEDVVTIKG